MTPEMVGYFSEELTRNASRGVRNVVSNVRLLAGDITESWEEGDLQYATAYMKWSAVDYLARLDRSPDAPDYVAGGDPSRPIEFGGNLDVRSAPRRQLAALGCPTGVSRRGIGLRRSRPLAGRRPAVRYSPVQAGRPG